MHFTHLLRNLSHYYNIGINLPTEASDNLINASFLLFKLIYWISFNSLILSKVRFSLIFNISALISFVAFLYSSSFFYLSYCILEVLIELSTILEILLFFANY